MENVEINDVCIDRLVRVFTVWECGGKFRFSQCMSEGMCVRACGDDNDGDDDGGGRLLLYFFFNIIFVRNDQLIFILYKMDKWVGRGWNEIYWSILFLFFFFFSHCYCSATLSHTSHTEHYVVEYQCTYKTSTCSVIFHPSFFPFSLIFVFLLLLLLSVHGAATARLQEARCYVKHIVARRRRRWRQSLYGWMRARHINARCSTPCTHSHAHTRTRCGDFCQHKIVCEWRIF